MNTDIYNIPPPQDINAEEAVIGSILKDGIAGKDNQALITVLPILGPEKFYKTTYSQIFSAILKCHENNEPSDLITVGKRLTDAGFNYGHEITTCIEAIISSANVEYYAKIVDEKYTLRKILEESYTFGKSVFEGIESKEILNNILNFTSKILIKNQDERTWRDILLDTSELIGSDRTRGIPCHLEKLDFILSGLHKKHLVVVAARPSHGKSALAFQTMIHASKKGHAVGMINLEMTPEELAIRAIACEARTDSRKLKQGESDSNVSQAYKNLENLPIHFKEMSVCTVSDVQSIAHTWKQKHNLELLIIDYLQLMSNSGETKNDAIGNTTRQLKNLSKELDICIILLSQLSRQNEIHNREPQLSDLRDSGEIEQNADDVIFIHNPDFDDVKPISVATISVSKQRSGPTCKFKSVFMKAWAGFETMNEEFEYLLNP